MPVTEARVTIPKPPQIVFQRARDIQALAQNMPNIDSIKILVNEPNRTVVEWTGRTHGRTVRWTEEDLWDPQALTCSFKQTQGDFDKFSGTWTFKAVPEGTEFVHRLEWELNIPLLGPLLQGVIKKAVQDNSNAIAAALAAVCQD